MIFPFKGNPIHFSASYAHMESLLKLSAACKIERETFNIKPTVKSAVESDNIFPVVPIGIPYFVASFKSTLSKLKPYTEITFK